MIKSFRTTFVNKNSWVSDFSGIKSNIKLKMSKAYRDYDISAVIDKDAYGEYKGKGFYYRTQRADDKGQFEPFAWDENDVGKTPLKYFQKIVGFCKKNNIELTCWYRLHYIKGSLWTRYQRKQADGLPIFAVRME